MPASPGLKFVQSPHVAKLQDGHGQLLPVGGARRHADAESLGVKGRANLHELAVDDGLVLVDGGVPEEGVVLPLDLLEPHGRVVHHGVWLDLRHLGPHLGEVLDLCVLQKEKVVVVYDSPWLVAVSHNTLTPAGTPSLHKNVVMCCMVFLRGVSSAMVSSCA